MDQNPQSAASGREYIVLDPNTQLAKEEDCDTLHVYLPGFKKKQLRLQLTTAGTLKITGERQFANNKWLHLEREYPVSTNCDPHKIDAKLEDGILFIRQPKLVNSPALKQEKEIPASEARKPDQLLTQKTDSEAEKHDQKAKNDQPQTRNTDDQETKSMVDQSTEKADGKKKSSDNKGELEREKGDRSNGKVDEEGKGVGKKTSDGQESCGWGGGRVAVVMGKRPVRMMMNLVVGLLLILVIGVYARNRINSAMEYGK